MKEKMKAENLINNKVAEYYSGKLRAFGPTPRGVDWNSRESQETRFEQLVSRILQTNKTFSINDLGCGFGSMACYLRRKGYSFKYAGYDVSRDMIEKARQLCAKYAFCRFFLGNSKSLKSADYTVASGIFNVKMKFAGNIWLKYALETLDDMNEASRMGFSFNMLTKYSDKEYMRKDLYYADPCFFFDYCKRKFSRNVALLHDYRLYEFTIFVRKV